MRTRPYRSLGRWTTPALIGAVLLLALFPSVLGRPLLAQVPRATAGDVPFFSPLPRLATPSNLTLPLANPHQNLHAGEQVSVSVAVEVANLSTPGVAFSIHLPTTVAEFPLAGGALLTVSLAPHNFQVAPNGAVGSPTLSQTVGLVAGANLSQDPNETALFTSGGLAVLTSLPYGTLTANFRWIWSVLAPNGALLNSSQWGPWTPIIPAQTAYVLSDGPSPVPAGTPFTVCLGGPTQNRVFSLHGQDQFGHEFGRASGRAPASNTTPFCLSLPVPALPAGSFVYVHVWEYAAATLLLHLVQTTVVVEPLGSISGSVRPILALVVLDGVTLPPLLGGQLNLATSAGPHELLVNASGYYPIAVALDVPANGSAGFNVTLTPIASGPPRFGPTPLVRVGLVPAAVGATIVAVAIALAVLLYRSSRQGPRPARTPSAPSPPAVSNAPTRPSAPAPPPGAVTPPSPSPARGPSGAPSPGPKS